jgi:hypothetical protein
MQQSNKAWGREPIFQFSLVPPNFWTQKIVNKIEQLKFFMTFRNYTAEKWLLKLNCLALLKIVSVRGSFDH